MPISRRSLALLLFLVISNAALAAVSAETAVGTPEYGVAPGYQTRLAVAASGSGYFAVWRDGRSFLSDDLIGTRISESGETLDPTGIFLARGPVFQPRVVWNGSSYLVVWSTDPGYGVSNLFAARVDTEGRVIMPATLIVRDALAIGDFLASDGTRSIVLYMGREAGREGALRAAVLDHEATVVTDLELAPADLSRGAPSIATNGSEYVVVWSMTHDGIAELQAIRLSSSGARQLDAAPTSLGRGYDPLIASDGHDFVVAARTSFNGESVWTTRAVAVSLSEVSDAELIAGSGNMFEASFFWAGGQYALVGPRFDFALVQYHAALVSVARDGSPSEIREADFVPTESLSPSMDAVAGGNTVVIVWTESVELQSGVGSRTVARLYSQAGSVLEPQSEKELLTTSANRQTDPVIAAAGSIRLVVWREESGIYATRVNAAGVSLDGRGLELDRDAFAGPPSVAFDGSQFVVAWRTASPASLVARFVSRDGKLLPGTVRFHGEAGGTIGLTAGGSGSLLAWTTNEPRIVVARISRATRAADSVPLAISPAGQWVRYPVPSWNGREFLVAWNELVDAYAGLQFYLSPDRVLGSRLTEGLTLIDTEPLLIGDAEGSDAGQRIASDGQDWLVAWHGGSQIRGQRILGGRVFGPQEGTPIAAGIGHDITWEGSRYAMVWKNAETVLLGSIERKGAIGPVSPQVIATARGVSGPSLAVIAPHNLAIVYGRIATEPLYGSVERAFLRAVTPDGPRRRAVR